MSEELKPVTHLVWLQGMRPPDDVEDYYEVARPGDKCVDGSEPFPVYSDSDLTTLRASLAERDEEVRRLREVLEKRPAAFEVLDTENGTYLTRSEFAALNTGFEYNGLYRRDSAEAALSPTSDHTRVHGGVEKEAALQSQMRGNVDTVHRLCELHDKLLRTLDEKVGIKVFASTEISEIASLILDAATALDLDGRSQTPPVQMTGAALLVLQEGIEGAEADMQSDADAGERVDLFDYEISLPYETAREIAALLRAPAPHQQMRVDELNEQRATGVGMAMAAAIVMRCWGKEVIARQILDSAGLSTLEDLKSSCVEQYDIDALLPVIDTTEGQP